jgi:hypothetical protein
MLKRTLSVSIALLATFVALVIYWIVFMPWLHFPLIRSEPRVKLIVALVGMVLAIYFFARWRTWPALLFLVGSIPAVLVNISMRGWEWRMNRGDSPQLALLFPSDNEHSPVNTILHYLVYFSLVCLPIAFFWYFFRVADRHLTKRCSEPLTGEKVSA